MAFFLNFETFPQQYANDKSEFQHCAIKCEFLESVIKINKLYFSDLARPWELTFPTHAQNTIHINTHQRFPHTGETVKT